MMPIFLLLFQDSFGMLRLSLTKQLGVLGHWASPLAFRFTLVPETWGCLTSGCQIILALMSKETGTNQQSWNQMNRLGSKFGLTRCTETSMKRKKERENFQSPDPTEIRLARFEWNIGIRFRGVELSLHLIFPLISSPQNRSALACIPEAHFNARALAWLFNYLDTLSQGTIKFKKNPSRTVKSCSVTSAPDEWRRCALPSELMNLQNFPFLLPNSLWTLLSE